MSHEIELVAPAGSMDKLKIALRYGADAVYLGGRSFNLRARSSNFSLAQLEEAADYVHAHNKRVFVALNIIAHERELKALPTFIKHLDRLAVDGVIVSDLGVLELVRENSSLAVHVSTQASVTNWRSARMWQQLGAKRCVLARELSLKEIRKIKDQLPEMELEVFVHGAMCMTYSGRCNLSSYFADRDGNRGACSNTCRWQYHLVEEKRPGEYFPVYEDDSGSYIYNSKDLCTIEFLDKILAAGVTALKIEGRMKSLLYCGVTTRTYRAALDRCLQPDAYQVDPDWLVQLRSLSHRGYTAGFFHGKLDRDFQNRAGGYTATHKYVGYVKDTCADNSVLLTVHEKITRGDTLEIIKPHGDITTFTATTIHNREDDTPLDVAQPNMTIKLQLPFTCEPLDLVRKAKTSSAPAAQNSQLATGGTEAEPHLPQTVEQQHRVG